MAGPWDVVSVTPVAASGGGSRGGWDVVSQEPVAPRSFMDRANDFTEVAADSMSFGLLPKLAAKVKELRGVGTYDENLAANRKAVEDANRRLGTGGSIAANIAGGALTGGTLADAGITLLGRLGQGANMATRIGAGVAEGAAYGAANEAGHSTADTWGGVAADAAKGAAIGGATGGVLTGAAAALPRIITPNPARSAEQTRLANVLRAEGVDVKASQATGAKNLATIEDAAMRMPMGRALSSVTPESQAEQLTQAAMRHSRVNGEAATFAAMNQAENQVGSVIGRVQNRYPIQQDAQYITDLMNVANDIPLLPDGVQNQVRNFINRMLPNGNTIDPRMAQALRTQLRQATPIGQNANPDVVRSFRAMREALDDALERTITTTGNPAHVDVLNRARQHYANIQVLRDGISRSGPDGQLGYLTPAALKNAQSASIGKTNYMRGRGDLSELAQAAAGVLPVKPGSQTAERSTIYDPVRWALSIPLNLAVNSRPAQAYLGNQVLPRQMNASPAVLQGLLSGGQNMRGGLL